VPDWAYFFVRVDWLAKRTSLPWNGYPSSGGTLMELKRGLNIFRETSILGCVFGIDERRYLSPHENDAIGFLSPAQGHTLWPTTTDNASILCSEIWV
jgi:hypothetical protein